VECPSEEIAFEEEKLLVAAYGRKDNDKFGILRNFTDGGDGPSGAKRSMETRQKHSEANRHRPPYSAETRCKLSEAAKRQNARLSPEERRESGRRMIMSQSPEDRRARAIHANSVLSKEELSANGRRGNAIRWGKI
jgi:hypothetical protein